MRTDREEERSGQNERYSELAAAYYRNPRRRLLYPILPQSAVREWNELRVERSSSEGGRERILYSRNMPGTIVYRVDPSGLARVADWNYCSDLLMFNPVAYFLRHPHINAIWCDTTDTAQYTASSAASDPTAVRTASDAQSRHSQDATKNDDDERGDGDVQGETTLNYALLLRRRELTPGVARILHDLQANYFTDNNLPVPPSYLFTSTLHGR